MTVLWEGLVHDGDSVSGCRPDCRSCFIIETTRKYINCHVAAERERCARVAEDLGSRGDLDEDEMREVAFRIRQG